MTGGPPWSASPSRIRQKSGCQCSNRAGWACQRSSQYSKEDRSVNTSPRMGWRRSNRVGLCERSVDHLLVQASLRRACRSWAGEMPRARGSMSHGPTRPGKACRGPGSRTRTWLFASSSMEPTIAPRQRDGTEPSIPNSRRARASESGRSSMPETATLPPPERQRDPHAPEARSEIAGPADAIESGTSPLMCQRRWTRCPFNLRPEARAGDPRLRKCVNASVSNTQSGGGSSCARWLALMRSERPQRMALLAGQVLEPPPHKGMRNGR